MHEMNTAVARIQYSQDTPALFLCLVTLTYDPKINVFPGSNVEHVYVKFGDSSCISF